MPQRVFLLLLIALAPASARAETCEEVQASCLEDCHVDFGMDAKRVELGKCVQRCDRALERCADLRQEEKRSQFRLQDPEPTPRRGDPADVRHDEDPGHADVRAAPEDPDGDEGEKPKVDKPRPRRADPQDADPPAKVDKPRTQKAEPDGEEPPPAKKGEPKKKPRGADKPDSEDDWAK